MYKVRMHTGHLEFLIELLERATERLAGVTKKRLFGCDALFVDDAIFGLIWKEGRIGLKFVDPQAAAHRLSAPGAKAWAPSGKPMRGWVLVPETFHDDEEKLGVWAREAHAAVRATRRPLARAKPSAGAVPRLSAKSKVRAMLRDMAETKAAPSPARKAKTKTKVRAMLREIAKTKAAPAVPTPRSTAKAKARAMLREMTASRPPPKPTPRASSKVKSIRTPKATPIATPKGKAVTKAIETPKAKAIAKPAAKAKPITTPTAKAKAVVVPKPRVVVPKPSAFAKPKR